MTQPITFIDEEPRLLHLTENDVVSLKQVGEPGHVGGRAWTPTDTLVVDVFQQSQIALPVRIAFGTDAASDAPALSVTFGVLPGVRTRLHFPLTALGAETVFLPRTPGRLKAVLSGVPTRAETVCWFSVAFGPVGQDVTVELSRLTLTDNPQQMIPEGPVLVDDLGQWTGRDWPGKVPDEQTLIARLRAAEEAPEYALLPGRNRYGGSAEITFDATGWFRTHHDGQRWWLVDPDGGAFWSAGPDCVEPRADCRVAGNEALCAPLPPRDGKFADAWNKEGSFSWPVANLIRAFGPDWWRGWAELTRKSLHNIGVNTVANWSDPKFARGSGLPYVLPLANFPTTAQTVFRDFPDVFAPEYAANAETFAAQLSEVRDDPNLIGYFLRNEPLWAFGAFRIGEEMLRQPPERAPHCRRAFARHLEDTEYASGEDAFPDDWPGCSGFTDIERLVVADSDTLTAAARRALGDFSRRMINAYVRIPSEACRRVDPNHLNLGMRWAWIATDDLLAGSDACDVFSLNCYGFAPDAATVQKAAQASGRPVLIGEFHFGAIDRGLPANGLRGVATQADRGLAYQYFVEQCAAMPEVIGAHYFQWIDQPFLGRFDGENWQIGIVDVCHAPYPEFAQAAQETHRRLYAVAAGHTPPLSQPPPEAPRLGF